MFEIEKDVFSRMGKNKELIICKWKYRHLRNLVLAAGLSISEDEEYPYICYKIEQSEDIEPAELVMGAT